MHHLHSSFTNKYYLERNTDVKDTNTDIKDTKDFLKFHLEKLLERS